MVTEQLPESIRKPVCDLLIEDDLLEPLQEEIKQGEVVFKQKPYKIVVVEIRENAGVKNEQDD